MNVKNKKTPFERYREYILSSSLHTKHFHAFVFAGSITALLAVLMLHFEYGFWRETYVQNETVLKKKIEQETLPPNEMFSRFFQEVKEKAEGVSLGKNPLLEGKKTYSKKDDFLSSTSSESTYLQDR